MNGDAAPTEPAASQNRAGEQAEAIDPTQPRQLPYRAIFDASPCPILMEDWSRLKLHVDLLRAGGVSVQSYQEHAFNEHHPRLLQILSTSFGVSLENARLFDETQALLSETKGRNGELAISTVFIGVCKPELLFHDGGGYRLEHASE